MVPGNFTFRFFFIFREIWVILYNFHITLAMFNYSQCCVNRHSTSTSWFEKISLRFFQKKTCMFWTFELPLICLVVLVEVLVISSLIKSRFPDPLKLWDGTRDEIEFNILSTLDVWPSLNYIKRKVQGCIAVGRTVGLKGMVSSRIWAIWMTLTKAMALL